MIPHCLSNTRALDAGEHAWVKKGGREGRLAVGWVRETMTCTRRKQLGVVWGAKAFGRDMWAMKGRGSLGMVEVVEDRASEAGCHYSWGLGQYEGKR